MAVGNKTAVFNADNSVALGYGSQVNGESNVLSVGAGPSGYGVSVDGAPETRRIINVSDGVKDSDAATKGQMDNAIADAVRVSGDSLRGEIGGVYRDARAHTDWICPYISRHLLSLNPLLACCRRYSRGER
nr:hypothetical protein [Escherichia coli]